MSELREQKIQERARLSRVKRQREEENWLTPYSRQRSKGKAGHQDDRCSLMTRCLRPMMPGHNDASGLRH